MSIDIKNLTQTPANRANDSARTRPSEQVKSDNAASTASVDTSDRLTLTGAAQDMISQLRQSMGDAAPVDQQRVESIRQQLANDTYQIDSLRLAENFLRKEGALPERR